MDLKGNSGSSSSSCIFFEASGDSEGDFDPNMGGGYSDEMARFGGYNLSYGHVDVVDDDDDAMSCSYDRSEYSCNAATEANWGESNCDDDDEEHDGDDVMKKEEKDGVYGTSYCEGDDEILQEENNHKSFVSFDSNQEFVDEMEKNRLFWEACLAS